MKNIHKLKWSERKSYLYCWPIRTWNGSTILLNFSWSWKGGDEIFIGKAHIKVQVVVSSWKAKERRVKTDYNLLRVTQTKMFEKDIEKDWRVEKFEMKLIQLNWKKQHFEINQTPTLSWLSFYDERIPWEIIQRIYLVPLTNDSTIHIRDIFAFFYQQKTLIDD